MHMQLIQLTDRSQGMPDAHAAHPAHWLEAKGCLMHMQLISSLLEAKGCLMHMQLIQLTDRSQVMPDAHAAHPAHY